MTTTRGTVNNTHYSFISPNWDDEMKCGLMRYVGVWALNLVSDLDIGSQWPDDTNSGQSGATESRSNKVLEGQTDADQKAGRVAAMLNNPYPNVQTEFPANWDVWEPVDMQPVAQVIAADRSPTGEEITLQTVPLNVTVQHVGGPVKKIQLVSEGLTDGKEGHYIDVRPKQTSLYGPYSSPISTPIKSVPISWGQQNSLIPVQAAANNSKGLLLATQDGYVAEGGWRNLSPSASQRSSIGTAIKLLADPRDYKRLFLFGSQGALCCDDKTVGNPPVWRAVNLASQISSTWTHTFDFTTSDGGWSAFCSSPAWASGGWPSGCIDQNSCGLGTTFAVGAIIDRALSAATLTSAVMTFDATEGPHVGGASNAYQILFNGVVKASTSNAVSGSGLTLTWTGTQAGVTSMRLVAFAGDEIGMCPASGASTITKLVLTGTGANPFGGSSSSTETFIADMQGSINRPGYFCWLVKRTVSGTDYVYFSFTTNYFRSVRTVQVAKYDSSLVYSISLRSYNSTATGVVVITAGTTSDSTAKVYKSADWGASWTATSQTLSSLGGLLNVPYAKSGGAANSANPPQYALVRGTAGGSIVGVGLAGGTAGIAAGTADYPFGPYSLNSFTLDGAYLSLMMRSGSAYWSSNAGVSWAAGGSAMPGSTSFIGYGMTGSPTNKNFGLGFGYRALAFTINRGSAWSDLWANYRAFAGTAFGSGAGEHVISAFADLSLLYSQAVSQ